MKEHKQEWQKEVALAEGSFQIHICLQRDGQETDSSEAFPLKLNVNVIT